MTSPKQSELYAHPGWRWCTAEGAREDILLRGLRSSMREKLEWLEEAETLALQFRAHRAQKGQALKPHGINTSVAPPK
jgi:hypothetical protein